MTALADLPTHKRIALEEVSEVLAALAGRDNVDYRRLQERVMGLMEKMHDVADADGSTRDDPSPLFQMTHITGAVEIMGELQAGKFDVRH